jgi:transcriptional regulator with XRE-family HTH domain
LYLQLIFSFNQLQFNANKLYQCCEIKIRSMSYSIKVLVMSKRKVEHQLTLISTEKGAHQKAEVVAIRKSEAAIEFNKMVAKNISVARKYAGLSQAELGQRIYGYVAKNRICEFELGTTIPDNFVLAQIAKHTGTSLDFLNGLSSEPALDEYAVRHALAMCIIQESLKEPVKALATLTARAVNKIPTSPTLVLIDKVKELKHFLFNVTEHNPKFEKKIGGSTNLINAINGCVVLAEVMERETIINMRHTERAARDAILHDEAKNGHLFEWESLEPARALAEE